MTLPEDVSNKARAYVYAYKKRKAADAAIAAAHVVYRETHAKLNIAAAALYAAEGLETGPHFVEAGMKTATYIRCDNKLLRLNYEYTTSAGIKYLRYKHDTHQRNIKQDSGLSP